MVPFFIGLVSAAGPFLFFRELEGATRRVRDAIYTPSRSSPGDATSQARRPMGSRLPALTLTVQKPAAVIREISV